jgi:hypothetical protein
MSLAIWWRKARRLALSDWLRLLEAGCWLALMAAGLAVLPFRWLVRLVGLQPSGDEPSAVETALAAARIGWAVEVAAARTPWRSTCLAQALAGAAMLRARGLPGVLYLGVQPSPTRAHAWLRHGDQILTGRSGHVDFAVIAQYSIRSNRNR